MSSSASEIRQCNNCFWVFKKEHTEQCPHCGSSNTEPLEAADSDELQLQTKWKAKELQHFEARLIKKIANPPCCYRSTGTNGWHHDGSCKKHVVCF